ncbi:NmrA family transcriptional regulator [Micromonospora sp. NPDC047670]|uniref:NmrA family NAD(P)-binding protein n=1 Tax=Micromonospora sp. NPDC047670 TaxID=3364252 RepID=UPI0037178837
MTNTNDTVLVLGGTGRTGRRVADRLAARGVPVRLGSRSAAPAFDWADRATWPEALAGVGAVYVSYQPDLAVPGAVETVESFTRLAVASGVRRVVLLSGRGEPEAHQAEKAVANVVDGVGGRWTVVRASWFHQNFSEGPFADGIREGTLYLPVGDVREPFVDADDIADVAVAALLADGHAGEVYEVTGPRLLTFAEAVAEIAAATGRPVSLVPVALAEYVDALRGAGVPADVVSLLTYLFTEVLDGRNQSLTDGVARALGRAPADFADYARAAAATGVWTA